MDDVSFLEDFTSLLEKPYNPMDPIVKFDPSVEKPGAAKQYVDEETEDNAPADTVKIDGIKIPIVMINTQVLESKYIESLSLRSTKFIPELELIINDSDGNVEFIGGPGLVNNITVIMTPQFDGLYRKIALPFYIVKRENLDTKRVKYICEFNNTELKAQRCMQVGDKETTTYEMCEALAKQMGLGFQCTEKCEDISDPRYRQIYSQKLSDFIEDQIAIGGLDEYSFFDAWIDIYAYLTLVNTSYIFKEDNKPGNLMVLEKSGVEIPINNTQEGEPFEMLRIVTNAEGFPLANLTIIKQYPWLNTENVQNTGALVTYWYLSDVGEGNNLVQEDVQLIEESIEGREYSDLYEFPKIEFLGAEMSEDTPYLMQQQKRRAWMAKKKSRQICVQLKEANFGIFRGCLILVSYVETDSRKIGVIMQNQDNAFNESIGEGDAYVVDDSVETVNQGEAFDHNSSIVNPTISGMYYVNGIEYFYSSSTKEISQYLFLIKKGESNPLFGFVASEKVSKEQDNVLNSFKEENE